MRSMSTSCCPRRFSLLCESTRSFAGRSVLIPLAVNSKGLGIQTTLIPDRSRSCLGNQQGQRRTDLIENSVKVKAAGGEGARRTLRPENRSLCLHGYNRES